MGVHPPTSVHLLQKGTEWRPEFILILLPPRGCSLRETGMRGHLEIPAAWLKSQIPHLDGALLTGKTVVSMH